MEKVDIEARAQRARALFVEGYNCAQSVFLAYADLYGLSPALAATIAGPLGGGMGRLREVCGAVSAAFLLTGLRYPCADPRDREAKSRSYRVVQELAHRFREENGSILCRELLGLEGQNCSPEPSPRTESYYKRRPCADYVERAARIIGKKLNEEDR
ncbi:MAG: C-GCAxxG-C-C family protein [Porphyromonadaceae bacterium]|nr:C-GCAxxG-C-C family protein [Porphyromonadaceae bacterium]